MLGYILGLYYRMMLLGETLPDWVIFTWFFVGTISSFLIDPHYQRVTEALGDFNLKASSGLPPEKQKAPGREFQHV